MCRTILEFLLSYYERISAIAIKCQGFEIVKWIKYVSLMKVYLEKVTPNVADAWCAHELYLKVKCNPKYLYALMDDQTRFWIAQ
jgi:hypothetical protein